MSLVDIHPMIKTPGFLLNSLIKFLIGLKIYNYLTNKKLTNIEYNDEQNSNYTNKILYAQERQTKCKTTINKKPTRKSFTKVLL